jgi:hypothetical protein
MGFEFTATAQCEYCGNYLDESGKACDAHTVDDLDWHYFRRINADESFAVLATSGHKWQKVADEKEEEWIEWVYVGPREYVKQRLCTFELTEMPKLSMAHESHVVRDEE